MSRDTTSPEYDAMARQCTIRGYRDVLMEAHGQLNELVERVALMEPDEFRKEMEYPCDPRHPMTEINARCQDLVSTIKEMSRRLGCLGDTNF